MRQDSTYRTVDELPNLLSKGKQQPTFKSVDELPDLKKKEPSEPLSKEPSDGGLDGTISTNKEPIPTIELYKTPSGGLVDDPFTRVKKSKDLSQRKRMAAIPSSGKAGEVFTEVPDEGSIKEAENITSELEGEGFGKDFIEAVSDMPEAAFRNPTTSKETLINLYGNNPVKFKQLTNEAKIKYAIQDAAAQKSYNELEGDKQRDEIAKNTGILEGNKYSGDERMPESMQQFYDIVRQKQELIDKNIDDPEQKKKYQGLLRQTYAPAISPESLDFKEEYQQSGLSGTIDINQYAGLKTLELFEPEKYKTYLNVVQDKIVPQWNVNVQTSPEGQTSGIVTDSLLAEKLGGQLSQLTINQRIGKEEVLRELSLMGANNEYDDLTSQQNDLKQLYKDAETDEQRVSIIAKSIENENRMKQLEQVELENDKKYPLTAKLKYENQVKEIVDDRGMGVGGFMYNRYAHGVGTGVDAVENLVTNIFGSEADKTKLRMKRIGEGKQFEADTYLPESERRTGSPVIIQASDELKKKAKEIINGRSLSSLSDEERQQLNNLVANNQSQIKTITNPEAGKSKNFLSKATGLSIAGFTADIGAFLTKMGMLQGVGLGAKAAEATTLFTDGYDAAYNKKISEGASSEDAHEYGILHGAVLSLMTKFGSKYETIMNTVKGGKSPLSKYIAGLSEKQWNKLSGEAEPLLKRVGKTVKGVAKEQGKMIGTFGVAAPTAASIADNVFYDENKSVEQIAKEGYESAKEMLIGSAGFIGLGLVKGAMKPKASPLEKMALWELGDNPELGIARIDEAVKKNEITAEEGTQKKEIIERVSKLIPQVPETTDKGKVLDDQQRIDYLYRLALKESYKEKSKILPEKQAEKVKQKALVIDKENQIELEGLTEKQANDRKDKLEKAISKVDDKGKPELSDKEMADAKAELEAIDNTIKKRKDTSIKEEELPDLSVPIEGTNEKGIPIGENVPAEVKGEPEKITQPIELSVSTKPADVQTDKGKMEGSVTDKIEVNDVVVALPEKGFVISDVTLNKGEEKGKGSGQEIYKKALDEYGTLYSSFPISEDAMRVQNKLVEKGIAKIETITLSDGTEIRKITKIKPTDVVPSNPTVQEGKPTDVVVDAKQQSGKDGVITPEVLLSNAEKNNDYEVLALKKQIEKGGIEGIRAKKKLDVITKVRNKEKLSDDEFIIATDADAQDVSDFKKLSNETAISRVESHRSDKPDVKIGNALTIATKMRIEKMVYDKTGEIVNSDAITLNELRDKIKSSTPKAEPQQSGKDVVVDEGVVEKASNVGGDVRTINDFANENESYRVIVGDEAFNDIIESGVVRTNADNKSKKEGGIDLGNRPTAFPSFSRGKASIEYAAENPNNYIIVTEDASIQPSKSGRHGKGTTMFPTDENGKHLKELSGDKVKVYKHIGDGKYELVYANGKAVEQSLSTPKAEPQQSGKDVVVDEKTKQQLLDERFNKIKQIKDKAEGTREERTKRYVELVKEFGNEMVALKKLQEEINKKAQDEIDKLPPLPKTENELVNEKGESDFNKIKKDLGFKNTDLKWGDNKNPFGEEMGDMLLNKDKDAVIFIKPNEVEVYDEINDSTDTITNGIKIELVSTKEGSRGKGKAKELIQKVTDWADKNNTDIYLDIAPQDSKTTDVGLKKLYESFGFEFDGIHGIRKPKDQSLSTKPEIKNEEPKVKIPIPKEEGGITEGVVSKVTSETGGAKEPPKEPAEPVGEDGSKKDGITHAAVEELRKIIGEPEYEGKPVENHETLIEEAQKKIKENPNAANEVLDKMENNGKITNKDNAVIAIYKATIDAEIAKNPTPELLKRATRLAKALDASGTELGKALESRKLVGKEDSLTNFLLDKQAAQGTALTEKQVKDEAAKYTELKAAKEALEKQLEQEREQHAKDIAELGINKAKAKAKREAKKSDEEYKAERKASVDAAREALKKLREGGLKSTIPGALELQAIAPHVKDFFNSLASQGVDKLDNIITQVHAEFKDVLDGLTKKNILDIVAGDFDQKKEKTKNEKTANIRLLKREVDLLKELERARKGEEKAKSETEKVSANRRIDELKKKIEEVQKLHKEKEDIEPVEDLSAGSIEDVAKYEAKLQRRIEKLNNDLKEGNYLKEPAKQPIFKKTRKAQILEDRVIDLENKIRHERSKDEYNKRSKTRKAFDKLMEVLGIKRLVQTALDMSTSFRQGATLLSPRQIDVWAKGFQANLQSIFSPKKFERIMYEIRHDQQYHEMMKDNVVFNDLGSADPNLHNEDFRKSFVYKIPLLSEPLKASNRSADAFLNVARYELYKKLRRNLESKGFTREADPKSFKYMGNWVMSMTGRGKMHFALEKPAMNAVLGNTFFGARLMASRFNLLNPVTYFDPRIPKEVRYEAMKDMVAFTTTMVTVATALSYTTGAKISLNPDDSDFLQLRYDDKVYDISGGLANYVRTGLRILKAGYTKATGTKYEGKEATKNAGQSVLNFFRNKLSPNTAYGVDAFFGGRYGEQFDPRDIYEIYPMYTDDFLKAIKEEGGVMATSTVLIPNILGIGYGSYASKGQIDKNLDDLLKRNLRSDEMNNEKIYNYNEGGRAVTLDEFEKFADKRDAEIEKDVKVLYNKGVGGTKYEDLTPEQVADEIKYIKATATRQVKEELFGKEKKSRADKKEQKNLTKEREEKYKKN